MECSTTARGSNSVAYSKLSRGESGSRLPPEDSDTPERSPGRAAYSGSEPVRRCCIGPSGRTRSGNSRTAGSRAARSPGAHPGDARSGLRHHTGRFVPQHNRVLTPHIADAALKVAVRVGAADSHCVDPNLNLARSRIGNLAIYHAKSAWLEEFGDLHRGRLRSVRPATS